MVKTPSFPAITLDDVTDYTVMRNLNKVIDTVVKYSADVKEYIESIDVEDIPEIKAKVIALDEQMVALTGTVNNIAQSVIDETAEREQGDTNLQDQIDSINTLISSIQTDIGEIETELSGKQNVLTAGQGIVIENDVISATGIEVPVDTEMSDTSTNPVQNKVIKAYVDSKGFQPISASSIAELRTVLTDNVDKFGYFSLEITPVETASTPAFTIRGFCCISTMMQGGLEIFNTSSIPRGAVTYLQYNQNNAIMVKYLDLNGNLQTITITQADVASCTLVGGIL